MTGEEALKDTLRYELIDDAEVARIAGVKPDTVRQWRFRKLFIAPVVGRLYLRREVIAWLVRTGRMEDLDA